MRSWISAFARLASSNLERAEIGYADFVAFLHRCTNMGKNGIDRDTGLFLRQLTFFCDGFDQIFFAH